MLLVFEEEFRIHLKQTLQHVETIR